jgi:hypothetical protein
MSIQKVAFIRYFFHSTTALRCGGDSGDAGNEVGSRANGIERISLGRRTAHHSATHGNKTERHS